MDFPPAPAACAPASLYAPHGPPDAYTQPWPDPLCNWHPMACPPALPMHAPVPVSAYSPLPVYSDVPPLPEFHYTDLDFPSVPPTTPPPQTFPTPSELLNELTRKGDPLPHDTHDLDADQKEKSETQRKSRRRAMTQRIGFRPTDIYSISSHDKKRHYLECLEYYVRYLHEQLNVVGVQPPPLKRVKSHKISSRSIRTILVHMETTAKELNAQALEEEQKFYAMRSGLLQSDHAAWPDEEYTLLGTANMSAYSSATSSPGSSDGATADVPLYVPY